MTSTRDATTTAIWPTFRYRHAPAAIRFLCEAFGFEEVVVYPGESEGTVAHAELRWPAGGGVMLGSSREDGPSWQPGTGSGSVYVLSHDIGALYERAQRAGAEIVRPLTDEEYGSREFTARDPEGGIWSFGTYGGYTP
jgi:uncharacterized glyoxalase superfamily protein PhnB